MDLFGKKAAAENQLLRSRISELDNQIQSLEKKLKELGYDDYAQVKAMSDRMLENARAQVSNTFIEISKKQGEADKALALTNSQISANNATIASLRATIDDLTIQEEKLTKKVQSSTRKLSRSKELYKAIEYAQDNYYLKEFPLSAYRLTDADAADYDDLVPSVILKLHAMDVRSLNKAFKENDKQIDKVMSTYSGRYTTKANQAIYKLMVIALRAELQNILINLKYEKLDAAIEQVKAMTAKYLAIATEGNQSIAGTMTRFIGEIEYLFMNAVKIEYNYYVKKEQARQEQAAIREQMKQERAERKALEDERKKIEAEESKYHTEIERVRSQMACASEQEAVALTQRILELESMLSDVMVKKEDIINLQNGKAGTVYVISNLGAFGENVFKIGMTRRLEPQDRIDELGSASVPFKFDVHSFIFSEDAVALESALHERLSASRVNKVNLRKEFFYSTVDELEALVTEIDPSAEFTKTMIAEEFRQSQSSDEVYTTDYSEDDSEDDDE